MSTTLTVSYAALYSLPPHRSHPPPLFHMAASKKGGALVRLGDEECSLRRSNRLLLQRADTLFLGWVKSFAAEELPPPVSPATRRSQEYEESLAYPDVLLLSRHVADTADDDKIIAWHEAALRRSQGAEVALRHQLTVVQAKLQAKRVKRANHEATRRRLFFALRSQSELRKLMCALVLLLLVVAFWRFH